MTILRPLCPTCQTRTVLARVTPALLASTFRPSNALRANTFIRLWLACWPTRWSLSRRTHGYAANCGRRHNGSLS